MKSWIICTPEEKTEEFLKFLSGYSPLNESIKKLVSNFLETQRVDIEEWEKALDTIIKKETPLEWKMMDAFLDGENGDWLTTEPFWR